MNATEQERQRMLMIAIIVGVLWVLDVYAFFLLPLVASSLLIGLTIATAIYGLVVIVRSPFRRTVMGYWLIPSFVFVIMTLGWAWSLQLYAVSPEYRIWKQGLSL